MSEIGLIPWTAEASVFFGKIKEKLEKKGEQIDDFDIAIASIAQAHECGVITANMKHFCRVENLECMTW